MWRLADVRVQRASVPPIYNEAKRLMDATESWLAANDPEYDRRSKRWIHVSKSDDYRWPFKEAPTGAASDVLHKVSLTQMPIEHGARPMPNHLTVPCRVCKRLFDQREGKNDVCASIDCKRAARREYMRDYMRRRRAA